MVFAAFLPMILGACAASTERPPSRVNIPAMPTSLAQPVAHPDLKAGDDAIVVIARYRSRLALANERIQEIRKWHEALRARYRRAAE